MAIFTKRLRLQTDCIGMVQQEVPVDMNDFENGLGQMIVNHLAKQYPDALTATVRISIDGILYCEAPTTSPFVSEGE